MYVVNFSGKIKIQMSTNEQSIRTVFYYDAYVTRSIQKKSFFYFFLRFFFTVRNTSGRHRSEYALSYCKNEAPLESTANSYFPCVEMKEVGKRGGGSEGRRGAGEGKQRIIYSEMCTDAHRIIACVASTPILTFIDSTIRQKKKKKAIFAWRIVRYEHVLEGQGTHHNHMPMPVAGRTCDAWYRCARTTVPSTG